MSERRRSPQPRTAAGKALSERVSMLCDSADVWLDDHGAHYMDGIDALICAIEDEDEPQTPLEKQARLERLEAESDALAERRIITPEVVAEIELRDPPEPPIDVRRARTKDGLVLVIGPIYSTEARLRAAAEDVVLQEGRHRVVGLATVPKAALDRLRAATEERDPSVSPIIDLGPVLDVPGSPGDPPLMWPADHEGEMDIATEERE